MPHGIATALDPLIAACEGGIVYPGRGRPCQCRACAFRSRRRITPFSTRWSSNWISAGARLVPLGQTDSQRVLAQLEPVVGGHGKRALTASLDDLGSATFRADLASLRHETQYTRLFRS